MKRRNFSFGLLLCVSGLVGQQAAAAPDPKTVYIKDFAANGDGCPVGTTDYVLTDDKTVLEILFSNFIAELAPPGWTVFNPATRACTVSLHLHLPPGIAVSWYTTEHRGFADTDGGAAGQFWARYYLPGQGGFDTVRIYNIKPGLVADYTVVNENLGGTWTKCGGDQLMSVNTRVRLSGKTNNNDFLTVDSETQKVETILRFKYKSCT